MYPGKNTEIFFFDVSYQKSRKLVKLSADIAHQDEESFQNVRKIFAERFRDPQITDLPLEISSEKLEGSYFVESQVEYREMMDFVDAKEYGSHVEVRVKIRSGVAKPTE